MTDGELVRLALEGRMSAYGELARRWSVRVLAVCRSTAGARSVSEDLAQETLLRGLRSLATLDDADKFGAWLLGIARRVALDWRKAKGSAQVPFSTLHPNGSSDSLLAGEANPTFDGLAAADDRARLLREVDRLPDDVRETLMLYYTDEFTYQELADLLGVSAATVNARLTKARACLRARLSDLAR